MLPWQAFESSAACTGMEKIVRKMLLPLSLFNLTSNTLNYL